LRNTDSDVGADLSTSFFELYENIFPCPGSSVGPEDNKLCGGSLTGFIKQEGNICGLASEHVLNFSKNTYSRPELLPIRGGVHQVYDYDACGERSR
jgi:hypothetical protein